MENTKFHISSDEKSDPSRILDQEYQRQQALYQAQPNIVQRFLEVQGRHVTEGLLGRAVQIRFNLPDRVVVEAPQIDQAATISVPQAAREHNVGGWRLRLSRGDLDEALRHRLAELEQSPDLAVSVAASLVRHGAVLHMVYNMLPSGRTVTYQAQDGESIPCIPVGEGEPESAITMSTDAIAEEGDSEEGRGTLQVPFVPYARRFYLPQWVAFDDQDNLLVGSLKEAEAHLASMQNFTNILHAASALAAYIVADAEYQKKRYGMLGQMVNQGRALARYKTREIIAKIKERAEANNLNRGLSLSLPYFNDQELKMETSNFEVIPAGRIMFVPAFVVRAVRQEAAKVGQDTRFNPSTRRHLLSELAMLEQAFLSSDSVSD
ncbi:MAG: hypothetical protein CVU44_18805 [Chloroflexi bacterium HGW-Chloroflexi-6]|nr:MAG: hypothetical protein CVU44_18805 [Chloroflexi bacterium HGW-Chloroflexi-6]